MSLVLIIRSLSSAQQQWPACFSTCPCKNTISLRHKFWVREPGLKGSRNPKPNLLSKRSHCWGWKEQFSASALYLRIVVRYGLNSSFAFKNKGWVSWMAWFKNQVTKATMSGRTLLPTHISHFLHIKRPNWLLLQCIKLAIIRND